MSKTLKGNTTLKDIGNYLHIEYEMDKSGQIMWTIETFYPAVDGTVLIFEFKSDQSFLNRLIKEWIDILTVFPIIGKP